MRGIIVTLLLIILSSCHNESQNGQLIFGKSPGPNSTYNCGLYGPTFDHWIYFKSRNGITKCYSEDAFKIVDKLEKRP